MITRKELDPDLSMTETRVHPECEGVLVNGVAKLQISMLPPPTKYATCSPLLNLGESHAVQGVG